MKHSLLALFLYSFVLDHSVLADKVGVVENSDTAARNTFWFSTAEFVVTEAETNAIVTVDWLPGNRGYTGYVDYSVTNGSAESGADFEAISGRLYFNSPASQTITIPIHADCISEPEETIQLSLFNTNAIITASNAVVKIVDAPCTPRLAIAQSGNQVSVTWDGSAQGFVLEEATDLNGTWTPVSSEAGRATVNKSSFTPVRLYRLRKP